MNSKVMILTCALLIACCSAQWPAGWPRSIQENQIQVLTLRQGLLTNARRSSPVPQLRCVGGGTAGCPIFAVPRVAQCYNRGSDGISTQWECKAELPKGYRFGKIDVSCEGYQYRDDPFVLVGSCGLAYTLDFTAEAWNTW